MLGRHACAWGLGAALGMAQLGCAMNVDDGDRFREPIPEASQVSLALPGSAATSTAPETLAYDGGGEHAKFYEFTRALADGVDSVTRSVGRCAGCVSSRKSRDLVASPPPRRLASRLRFVRFVRQGDGRA
jgi:hypothetical protein